MIHALVYDANQQRRTPLRAAVNNALMSLGSQNHSLLRTGSLEEMKNIVLEAKSGFFEIVVCRIDPTVSEALAVLRAIREEDPNVCMVVMADDPKYAVDAYGVGACGYCLVQDGMEGLTRALAPIVERAVDRHSATTGVRCDTGVCNVVLDHIVFVEASRKGALMHLASGETKLVRSTLQTLFEKLAPKGDFVEVGSSFIVNLTNVRQVGDSGAVIFESGDSIVAPIRVRKDLKEAFLAFWQRPVAVGA